MRNEWEGIQVEPSSTMDVLKKKFRDADTGHGKESPPEVGEWELVQILMDLLQ